MAGAMIVVNASSLARSMASDFGVQPAPPSENRARITLSRAVHSPVNQLVQFMAYSF